MGGFDGALALKLDFGERATLVTSTGGRGRAGLRLAPAPGTARLTGPDKYRQLDARRRQAQINARRLLDVIEGEG
jgi:LmbE family N-acetylglucosaminyl deacetylase